MLPTAFFKAVILNIFDFVWGPLPQVHLGDSDPTGQTPTSQNNLHLCISTGSRDGFTDLVLSDRSLANKTVYIMVIKLLGW